MVTKCACEFKALIGWLVDVLNLMQTDIKLLTELKLGQMTLELRFQMTLLLKLLVCFSAADREHAQNVAVRAAARPQVVEEERAAGMPRRRRNLHSRMTAHQRTQQNTPENGIHASNE